MGPQVALSRTALRIPRLPSTVLYFNCILSTTSQTPQPAHEPKIHLEPLPRQHHNHNNA